MPLKLDLDELVTQIREYQAILSAHQVIKPETPSAQLRQYADDLGAFIQRAETRGSLKDTRDQILLERLDLLKRLGEGDAAPADAPDVEYAVQLLACDWIAGMHRRLSAQLVRQIELELADRKRRR